MYRQNNFDILRLFFAVLVLISHSFELLNLLEPLRSFTSNQVAFSDIGLYGFFTISGYLIFQSFENSTSVAQFIIKRILRIFPALILILILTIPAMYFFYTGTSGYWREHTTWSYFPSNLSLYFGQLKINGVFTSNPDSSDINGSLWTIAYEFTCYLFTAIFFITKSQIKYIKVILIGLVFYLIYSNTYGIGKIVDTIKILKINHLFNFGAFYLGGSLIAVLISKSKKLPIPLVILSITLLVCTVIFNSMHWIKYIALPILIVGIGTNTNKLLVKYIPILKMDLSYGIYLSAFVIQQILIFQGCKNPYLLCFYTLLLSTVYAFFSWYLLEKRALSWKIYFTKRAS